MKEFETFIEITNEIESIVLKYNQIKKDKKLNFNFFSAIVSGKNSREHIEMYHSNIISYFLNPNGNHDCDSFFLKEFIRYLNTKTKQNEIELTDSEINSLKSEREKMIDSGRFIDISLVSKNTKKWIIFIENKFRSNELENQFSDYCLYAEKNYENGICIFLSLSGYKPNSLNANNIINNPKFKHFYLSYNDIINWLEDCLDSDFLKNELKITDAIKQYIESLKKTLNIMENVVQNEIVKMLNENLEKASLIYRNIDLLQSSIVSLIEKKRADLIEMIYHNLENEIKKLDFIKIQNIDFNNKSFSLLINNINIEMNISQSYPDFDEHGKGLWIGFYKNGKALSKLGLQYNNWSGIHIDINGEIINDYTDCEVTNEYLLSNNKDRFNEVSSYIEKFIMDILIEKKKLFSNI